MECIDAVSFLMSLAWSGAMVALVVKLDHMNGFESGLKDIFSTPIVSTLVISIIFVYLTYEAPTVPEHQSLATIAERGVGFVEYAVCSFVSVLNVWGVVLFFLLLFISFSIGICLMRSKK